MSLQCPHCQSTIVFEGKQPREVVCPCCGSSIQLDPDATTGWLPEEAPKRLGKFEFLELLGSGSFGTVYKARDTELGRLVAVKIPRSGSIPKVQDLDRFLREARSAAQLTHPGIVSLYDAGTIDGTCCLVSEFIQGATLAERLSARRFSFRQAAELLAEVADALHYAHQHGVVHRDIKPSNIMLDLEGRPHLMDFGLAKRSADEITLTLEGQVLGTPAYMSPEQARGDQRRVDARSDLYSLGVILYELLTGELPFRGQTRMLLVQVIQDEPRPPRRLNDRIPRDLETVCLKAMAKEPARRYESAHELAADLRRFLKGEPIKARPVSRWERAWVWAKRRPAVAGLLAVGLVAALALVGTIVGAVFNTRLQGALEETQRARDAEKVQRQRAERFQYFHHIAVAHAEWRDGSVARVEPLLDDCSADQRHWEWDYLKRLCHGELLTLKGHTGIVRGAVFSPDGTRLASGSIDKTVRIWDARSGEELHCLRGHTNGIRSVAISADGKRIASASYDESTRIWDAVTGLQVLKLEGGNGWAACVAFSPDGTRLAVGNQDGWLTVWDTTAGTKLRSAKVHDRSVHTVAFSPDGARLAAEGPDNTVKVWDARTGQEALILRGHRFRVLGVSFSPDGGLIASASADQTVKVWDAATGKEALHLSGHTGDVWSVAFSPDGAHLVSASVDQTVRVWNARTGQVARTFKGHAGEVISAQFSPDGARIASAADDRTVRVWGALASEETLILKGHTGAVESVAFSPDSRRIASAADDSTVRVWDVTTNQEVLTLKQQAPILKGAAAFHRSVVFSPDGKRLASAGFDRTVRLWDTGTGQEVRTLKAQSGLVNGVAFSPGGEQLASSAEDGSVRLWDAATGQEGHTLIGHDGLVHGVAFSPDGSRLASAGFDRTVRLWDVATGQEVLTLRGHNSWVNAVAFSPDGKQLASASTDNTVRVWDAATGQQVLLLAGHSSDVNSVAFSPDGTRIASASRDGTLKVWDAATGQAALTLRGHTSQVRSVVFSRDGTRLVSAGMDHTIRLWDARPWAPEAALEREAISLLEFLFARPLSKADVLVSLNSSPTLRPEARKMALALVQHYREETDPECYYRAAWQVIRHPYANVFMSQYALAQTKTAFGLSPDNDAYRRALGVAQYRLGKFQKERYAEALATLTRCDQDQPATLAFLVMTQEQLGQKDQARTTLARLRDIMKQERWAKDVDAPEFLREAEALIYAKHGKALD